MQTEMNAEDRQEDQQHLIPYTVSNTMSKIELTLHMAHSESYEATTVSKGRVNLKTKITAGLRKLQHVLRLGGEKPVSASFGEQSQTKIGGAPLLLELERTEGLVRGAAGSLRDWRYGPQVTFSLWKLLWQRVLLICCGYEDVIDGVIMSHDPGLQLALGYVSASQSTVCRFENKMRAQSCYRLAAFLVYCYIAEKKEAPKSIRLDFDGSCVPTRGQQQGSSYRKYYDTQMYFPLFVFDQDGVLITAILRPGEDGEAKMTVSVLKRLVKAFRQAWSGVEITVVLDSGFNDPDIYDWCEDQGAGDPQNTVYYLVKLKNTHGGLESSSKEMAKAVKISFGKRFGEGKYLDKKTSKTKVEKAIRRKPKKERMELLSELDLRIARKFGEFMHCTGKGGQDKKQWRQDRRVLAQCTYDDWGDRRSFWVTNIVGSDAETLINDVYSRRGEAELRIRDAKSFRCDKLSCQEFLPNQFRLLEHVLAQRLLMKFRNLLPQSMRQMSLESVREHFLKIPALVKEKAKNTELAWSASFPFKNQMHALCQRLRGRVLKLASQLWKYSQFLKLNVIIPPKPV